MNLVLKQHVAVKGGKAVGVGAKTAGYPVHDHADAGAVELRLIRPEKDGKQAFLITAAFPVRQITTVQSHLDSYMTRNEECS